MKKYSDRDSDSAVLLKKIHKNLGGEILTMKDILSRIRCKHCEIIALQLNKSDNQVRECLEIVQDASEWWCSHNCYNKRKE